MLAKDWMSKKVVSINEEDTIQDVMKILSHHKFHMLPAVNKDKLVGVITRRDMMKALFCNDDILRNAKVHSELAKTKVKDVMTKDIVTVPSDYTVEQVAGVFLKNQIHSAPVVSDAGKIKGMITQTDLSRALVCLAGGNRGGILFAFMLEDRPGSIKELTDIIRQYGGRMYSILTSYEDVTNGFRKLYIRAYGIDSFRLRELTELLGKRADLIYMLDRLEIVRNSDDSALRPNNRSDNSTRGNQREIKLSERS